MNKLSVRNEDDQLGWLVMQMVKGKIWARVGRRFLLGMFDWLTVHLLDCLSLAAIMKTTTLQMFHTVGFHIDH
jgi:hypothetical protein